MPENPAEAPWYFLGLQELVSFSAFMGGVGIPAIVLLRAGANPVPGSRRTAARASGWAGRAGGGWSAGVARRRAPSAVGDRGGGDPVRLAPRVVPDSRGGLRVSQRRDGQCRTPRVEVAYGRSSDHHRAPSTTSLLATDHPTGFVYGQNIVFTVTVHQTPGIGVPSGTVQLVVNGANFAEPVPLVSGTANIGTTRLPAGRRRITVVFVSDSGIESVLDDIAGQMADEFGTMRVA